MSPKLSELKTRISETLERYPDKKIPHNEAITLWMELNDAIKDTERFETLDDKKENFTEDFQFITDISVVLSPCIKQQPKK